MASIDLCLLLYFVLGMPIVAQMWLLHKRGGWAIRFSSQQFSIDGSRDKGDLCSFRCPG